MITGFPDWNIELGSLRHGDDFVFVEVRMTGTHQRPWAGWEPTGRRMDCDGGVRLRSRTGSLDLREGLFRHGYGNAPVGKTIKVTLKRLRRRQRRDRVWRPPVRHIASTLKPARTTGPGGWCAAVPFPTGSGCVAGLRQSGQREASAVGFSGFHRLQNGARVRVFQAGRHRHIQYVRPLRHPCVECLRVRSFGNSEAMPTHSMPATQHFDSGGRQPAGFQEPFYSSVIVRPGG